MQYRAHGQGYVIVLSRGEEMFSTLTAFAQQEKVTHAWFDAIGALEKVTIGYYELSTKTYHFATYPETFEVASLHGNCALVDNAPFLHVHAVLSRCDATLSCIGGHVKEAWVAVTLEVHMTVGSSVARVHDDTIGLKLLSL